MTLGRRLKTLVSVATAAAGLGACGGGGALDNPDTITNPAAVGGQKLSFAYFQYCVNPVLKKLLRVDINGAISNNTCAASGCHDNGNGTGGALRLFGSAPDVGLTLPAADIRLTDMYKNYYSSLGESVVGGPDQSRLLNKPLVRGVLHGGGVIFTDLDQAEAKLIRYWINRPMPSGQDEFSAAANTMFATGVPGPQNCNTD